MMRVIGIVGGVGWAIAAVSVWVWPEYAPRWLECVAYCICAAACWFGKPEND